MATEIKNGRTICQSGQPFHSLHMIMKGTVRAVYSDSEFFLDKGDIIGLCELFHDSYIFNYIAADDVTIVSFSYTQGNLNTLFYKSKDIAPLAASSCFKQMKNVLEVYEFSKYDCDNLYHYLMDSYSEYVNLCGRYKISSRSLPDLENIEPLTLEEDFPGWLSSYYENMAAVVTHTLSLSPVPYADYLNGLLMKTSQDIADIMSICRIMFDYKADIGKLLMNENKLDLFDLYTSLFFRIGQNQEDSTFIGAAVSRMMINLDGFTSIERELSEARVAEYKKRLSSMDEQYISPDSSASEAIKHSSDVAGSLHTILEYADCEPEINDAFCNYIDEYKKLIDKNSTDDDCRKLRLNIAKLFYQIYTAAFQVSLQDKNIPILIKMFLQFGYVDEELAGIDNASYLYSIADSFPSDPSKHVFTIYEWLRAIYEGKKEPSRNEFDIDYTTHIHELKVTGKISAVQEAQMASNRAQKVMFELENMFPIVNKVTFGRLTTFCPIFSEHNVLKDLHQSSISSEKVLGAINEIRSLDYSAFCRDTIYTNPENGVAKEYISLEILPDIILMPNVGIRGVMWQEIEGMRRSTPSRMMISIFQMEDILSIISRLVGEFRWEMCRRVQGARWNDVSDRSLTSEYFDYIQFYKKNADLTPEAKDKIKSAMQKSKNSYKEMFIRDYITWIMFEGKGSPRLNKVARNIIFTYCPFSKDIRTKLQTNPMYKDMMDKYDIRTAQKLHHMDNLYLKLKNSGLPIPKEIEMQRKFLES